MTYILKCYRLLQHKDIKHFHILRAYRTLSFIRIIKKFNAKHVSDCVHQCLAVKGHSTAPSTKSPGLQISNNMLPHSFNNTLLLYACGNIFISTVLTLILIGSLNSETHASCVWMQYQLSDSPTKHGSMTEWVQVFWLLSYGTESQARTYRTVIKLQFHYRILTAAGKRYYKNQRGSQFIKCGRTLESRQAYCFLRYFGR